MTSRVIGIWLLAQCCLVLSVSTHATDRVPSLVDSCASQTTMLHTMIQNANYCAKAEDCTIEYFGCPFGCETLLNRHEASKVRNGSTNITNCAPTACIDAKWLNPVPLSPVRTIGVYESTTGEDNMMPNPSFERDAAKTRRPSTLC